MTVIPMPPEILRKELWKNTLRKENPPESDLFFCEDFSDLHLESERCTLAV